MIKSMTGYGKSNLSINAREYQVEIKSVNHRYLDISVKMPRVLSYLEEDVKKEIASKDNTCCSLAKIFFSIRFKISTSSSGVG